MRVFQPTGAIQMVRERPWSTVLHVPLAGGSAWFKACSPVQAFEPRLSADLFRRWPDRVGEVLAYDSGVGWLLLADAGVPSSERRSRRTVAQANRVSPRVSRLRSVTTIASPFSEHSRPVSVMRSRRDHELAE